jgi:hypothetical protein
VEDEAHISGALVPVYIGASGDEFDSADHWVEQEVGNLRADLEESDCALLEAEEAEEISAALAAKWQGQYLAIKSNIEDKVNDMNGKLRMKTMIYLDLIAEYETVLASYARYGQVRLTTTKITDLRKRGGLE